MIHRPIAPAGRFVGRELQGAPDVAKEAVRVVDGLDVPRRVMARPRQQHRAGAEERLDVVFHVAEGVPDLSGDGGFAAEVGEWGL